MDLSRITTRDILAVMTVAAALLFNGISLVTGRDADVATMTLAGAVVGYYFRDPKGALPFREEPLEPPVLGDNG